MSIVTRPYAVINLYLEGMMDLINKDYTGYALPNY